LVGEDYNLDAAGTAAQQTSAKLRNHGLRSHWRQERWWPIRSSIHLPSR